MRDRTFRRNFLVIAALHVGFVAAIYVFSALRGKPVTPQVMWLEGGSFGGGESPGETAAPEPEPPPEPPPSKLPEPQPPPPEAPAPSELVMPKATPEPATPTPKPTTPTPKPPSSKPPPKPKPATPKSSPKATASASPKAKPSPGIKPKSSPGASREDAATSGAQAAATGGNSPGTGNGKGPGKTGGGSGASEFGWYFSMIHDRFHNRWEQPTSIVRATQEFVTTLKIRINKDGAILSREIVRSSGDVVMDESVMAAAQRVQQIDPLPAGLGADGVFEVHVAFKLDQGL